MIPRRIKVKGFMSYRDETELRFDGATLWMLAGPNGAGKSALFDAITYALFEQHRLGKSNHKGLINLQADSLVVEYEFAIGDDVYCIKRTLSQQGKSSRLVYHIKGPNAPTPGKPGPQSLPETESPAGFENWMDQTIGLSYETFTASVLLLQGKSDALLVAQPRERHDMLSQIVNLSRYEQLYSVAGRYHKQWQAKGDMYQGQLGTVDPVNETRLAELPGIITAAESAESTMRQQIERLVELKVHAQRWNKLDTERVKIEIDLEKFQELFEQSKQIEHDAAKLGELKVVTPLLRAFVEERERMELADRHIRELGDEVTSLERQLQAAAEELEEKQGLWDNLKSQNDAVDCQRQEAQEALDHLAPDMDMIREIDRLLVEIEELDQKLEAYEPDLDERTGQLQSQVLELTELSIALPWLRQYVEARTQWHSAQTQEAKEQAALAQIALSIPPELAPHGVTTAAAYAEYALKEVTRLTTLVDREQEQLARIDDLEGKPTCPYCGQPLTAHHIETEREHVTDVLQNTRRRLVQAEQISKEAEDLKRCEDTIHQTLRTAYEDAKHATSQATSAMHAMPTTYAQLIEPATEAKLTECFVSEYPTAADIEQLSAQENKLEAHKDEFASAQAQTTKRDAVRVQRTAAVDRSDVLEVDYSHDRISTTRAQHQSASDELKAAKKGLKELALPLKNAEIHFKKAEDAYKTTDSTLRDTRAQQQQEDARYEELRRIVAEKAAVVPAGWQSECDILTAERLEALADEVTSLAGADDRYKKLMEAREQETRRRESLKQIELDQADIPEEARCPVPMLEEQEGAARKQAKAVTTQLKAAEEEMRVLEARRKQLTELTDMRKNSARLEYLYKELARLLGRDNLQRHLLQQAERGIVANANEVLDRISGGTLRLELSRDDASDEEPAGKNTAKALDLVAYNSEIGVSPLSIRALSGSQRFRASVSLALGIGYWAGKGAQRIETVIIDEGFGSLDQQGRHDMIDELHNLKAVLSRIIVVSHQEEFFRAFSCGYRIELVGGTSKVNDLDTSAIN